MKLKSAIFCLSISSSGAFSVNNGRRDPSVSLHAIHTNKGLSRPEFVQAAAVSLASLITMPQNADALVKGNAPPPKKGVSDERKCRNVEECQEMADRLADKVQEEARANMIPASLTKRGTAYRDVVEAPAGVEAKAKLGDTAKIYYKVLKLGKRSYDGLSGEGTVVFSRGYGLEDDEDKAGVKSFSFAVGQDDSVIGALNDGIVGQKIGSTRRISITPQMGWEKASKECDGGPGGSGSGGELKTDYVVVPTATMVATEICFDKEKRPFPKTYAEQRRMAQRFDQSLIIEVELVDLK
uniref:peptidylprolyl isomerase n=1 Tax=Chaetoceros debilis TaxID=122233 RepID=A0A7S3QIQ5_9STRA|mmetsp:Transcript_21331/g.32420  ORF Transcript_21331/g.32420 Transcript_21331/m.32420 type:complete len:296 (+) Transcript_21331:184-1071(+)